jgi:hypothetical protein
MVMAMRMERESRQRRVDSIYNSGILWGLCAMPYFGIQV